MCYINGIDTSFVIFIISLSHNTHLNKFPVLYLLIFIFSTDVDFNYLIWCTIKQPLFGVFLERNYLFIHLLQNRNLAFIWNLPLWSNVNCSTWKKGIKICLQTGSVQQAKDARKLLALSSFTSPVRAMIK